MHEQELERLVLRVDDGVATPEDLVRLAELLARVESEEPLGIGDGGPDEMEERVRGHVPRKLPTEGSLVDEALPLGLDEVFGGGRLTLGGRQVVQLFQDCVDQRAAGLVDGWRLGDAVDAAKPVEQRARLEVGGA